MRKALLRILILLIVVFVSGFLIPQNFKMPVQDAGKESYNKNSFWYYPWGKSVTHKGVDVFANKGTPVLAATPGVVVFSGLNGRGGKSVIILGPKWRFHYYAHLNEIMVSKYSLVQSGRQIGTVGNTGNARGRPSHLHYSIVTPIPYPWKINMGKQGFRRMFYLNPINYLSRC